MCISTVCNKQKNGLKNLFFVCILKIADEKSRIRSRRGIQIRIRNLVYPDPDPSQNVKDSGHCFLRLAPAYFYEETFDHTVHTRDTVKKAMQVSQFYCLSF